MLHFRRTRRHDWLAVVLVLLALSWALHHWFIVLLILLFSLGVSYVVRGGSRY